MLLTIHIATEIEADLEDTLEGITEEITVALKRVHGLVVINIEVEGGSPFEHKKASR